MKKIIKRILIGLIVSAVLIVGAGGIFMFRLNQAFKTMSPVKTQQINAEVYTVKDSVANIYIVKKDAAYIVFDAGNDSGEVARQLAILQIDPLKVAAVFLTHTDSDHVAALSLFKNATVYISRPEEQLINGSIHRMFIFNNKLDRPYTMFDDNQIITVGGIKVRAILTPGHTPGSTCFVVNDAYLFTGDTLGLHNGVAGQFSELFNMDTKTQLASHERLKNLTGIKSIYTGHHGYTNDYYKAFGITK